MEAAPGSASGTSQSVGQRFAATNDIKIVNEFLASQPTERRSAAAVELYRTIKAHPAAMRVLVNEGYTAFVVFAAAAPIHPQATQVFAELGELRLAITKEAAPAAAPDDPKVVAARENLRQQGALRQNNKDGVSRSYGFDADIPAGKAQAVAKEGYVDGMRPTKKGAEAKTRGTYTARTVGVLCTFEVGLINPRTGQPETVVFKGVEDHRPAGWGSEWYDTAKDVDSKVLVCSGQVYSKGQPSTRDPMQIGSGSMIYIGGFDYTDVPDLKRRVEQYLQTGDTGNKTAKK